MDIIRSLYWFQVSRQFCNIEVIVLSSKYCLSLNYFEHFPSPISIISVFFLFSFCQALFIFLTLKYLSPLNVVHISLTTSLLAHLCQSKGSFPPQILKLSDAIGFIRRKYVCLSLLLWNSFNLLFKNYYFLKL